MVAIWLVASGTARFASADSIDFNRDIRPILASRCFACHGPDEDERQADLRLDIPHGMRLDLGGYAAVSPGDPAKSELLTRVSAADESLRMPPPDSGEALSASQIELLRRWIEQGAKYDVHWSYAPPGKPRLPAVSRSAWSTNPVDRFLLARLEKSGLQPAEPADRFALARRVSLDLTGLPPSWEEVTAFVNDSNPDAYRRFVDATLAKSSFGEHWAQLWLDLARYADSSGYPSDQPRQIWGYRDWVIDAFNRNLPFDQFTIEQLAGDLLPNASDSQLIATAFHRNTMTQNEGGTSDEEFRVAAVIDRVNTTMAVWMGTTMACAQCHTHKYDPITQQEYFQFYAILNQTADADRQDEAPLHEFFTDAQALRKAELQRERRKLLTELRAETPAALAGLPAWEDTTRLTGWTDLPGKAGSTTAADIPGKISFPAGSAKLAVRFPINDATMRALRFAPQLASQQAESSAAIVLQHIEAELVPDSVAPVTARRLRIELISDKVGFLALSEVQVFSGRDNVALRGRARQISTAPGGPDAGLAIDGDTNGNSKLGRSVAVTVGGRDTQWWEVEFDADVAVDRIVVWKRTDKGKGQDLRRFQVSLLDADGREVWKRLHEREFKVSTELSVSGRRRLLLGRTYVGGADGDTDTSGPRDSDSSQGWAVRNGGRLTALLAEPVRVDGPSELQITLQLQATAEGGLQVAYSQDDRSPQLSSIPAPVLGVLDTSRPDRTAEQQSVIKRYYLRQVAPELQPQRDELKVVAQQLAAIRPHSVPVMQELGGDALRETRIQRRGNWQDVAEVVEPGVPAVFHPLPPDRVPGRLALAQWLVSAENPLASRVAVNRFWEAIFGVGIVSTSEEFGSQGEPPLHPQLLDWLATEFMDSGWDVKRLLRQLVTSQAYQQRSNSDPRLNEVDPDNRLLARGPRFRPTGELLRDQALAVGGLMSQAIGGPPVRPPAPSLGLKTAFGRSNDWTPSEGEDRYRRSVYTEVQRNSPYASFSTFDAPNREVCTIRRSRTNTPLQAFVTLNDPVFVEANQALARRLVRDLPGASPVSRISLAYRICLSREPDSTEIALLSQLYAESYVEFQQDPEEAEKMATDPIGAPPEGVEIAELAAWTLVANVIMNLDEFLMRR